MGGTKALVSGLGSTNYQQGIIPGCTVSVYLTGTTTLATIYSNSTGTPLANPFTAVLAGSPNPGYWIFYAATGQGYDVKLSGGGGNPLCTTAPNCYTTPLTYTDLKVGSGGGGGGGLTFFSAGNDPPLFNTVVSNPGTTPNLAFSPISQGGNTVFGNFTGASAQPFFAQYACTGLLACTFNSGTNTWTLNVPSTSTLSVTATSPIRVNGGTGPVSSGTANIDCPTCAGNPQMLNIPPDTNQGVFVPFTNCTITTNNSSLSTSSEGVADPGARCTATTADLGTYAGGLFNHNVDLTATFTNPDSTKIPAGATITAIYALSYNNGWAAYSLGCSPAGNVTSTTGMQAAANVGTTTLASVSCQAEISQSVFAGIGVDPFTVTGGNVVSSIGLWVEYTGAAPPLSSNLNIAWPLRYDSSTNTLGVFTRNYPNSLTPILYSNLTNARSVVVGTAFLISDATSTTGVCSGGGTNTAWATSDGANWNCSAFGGGGGSGSVTSVATGTGLTGGPITTSGTISCVDSTSSTKGCVQVDGTTITATGGVISAVGGGGGGLSGQTTNYLPKATSATASTTSSIVEDQGTGIVVHGTGTSHGITLPEGTAISASAGNDILYADSANHCIKYSANGGSFSCLGTSGVTQIIAGTNVTISPSGGTGAVTINASGGGGASYPFVFPINSYGGVADGNLTANTGTDNTSAWSAAYAAAVANGGGAIQFACGQYRFAGAGPAITASNIQIIGTPGCTPPPVGGLPLAQAGPIIFTSSASATVISITGTSTSNYLTGNAVNDVWVARAVSSATGSIGVSVHYTAGFLSKNVIVTDSAIGFDIDFAPSNNQGFINDWVFWGYVANTIQTSATALKGFNLKGDTSGFQSLILQNNGTFINSNLTWSATTYGYYVSGSVISDLYSSGFNTAGLNFPIYIDGGSGGTSYTASDVHFNDSVLDQCQTDCVYVTNVAAAMDGGIYFKGGWFEAVSGGATHLVDIENSTGIAISNVQMGGWFTIGGTVPSGAMAYVHNSVVLMNGVIQNWGGGGVGAHTAASLVIDASQGGVYTNNRFISNVGAGAVQFTGSSSNIGFQNNEVSGGATYGITTDAGTNHIAFLNLNNVWGYSTAALNDLGSSNQFSSATAWGSITGTLSSQTDLQTALNAKAPTASPTFTGTPDASGATQFKLPVAASGASAANGEVIYDSTNKNWHLWQNGVDKILAPLATGFVSGHCGQPTSTTGTWEIQDAGGACGVSGGGSAFSAITTGTNTSATMTVGSGASVVPSGTGVVQATNIASTISAGSGITITGSGTTSSPYSITASGGTSSFPYTVYQAPSFTPAGGTSWTWTLPQALQASGATAMFILALDASGGSSTGPSGSTCTINVSSGTNFPRLMVCLLASSGQTSVTFSTSASTTPSVRLIELSGTRTFDVTTSTSYTSGTPSGVSLASFTPTAGSAVFQACTGVTTTTPAAGLPLGIPGWQDLTAWNTNSSTGRYLEAMSYISSGAGVSLQPPMVPITFSPFSSSGVSCAAWSIK